MAAEQPCGRASESEDAVTALGMAQTQSERDIEQRTENPTTNRNKNKKCKKKKKKKKKSGKSKGGAQRHMDAKLLAAILASHQSQSQSQSGSPGPGSTPVRESFDPGQRALADPLAVRQRLQGQVDSAVSNSEVMRARLERLELKRAAVELRIIAEKKRKSGMGGVQASAQQQARLRTKQAMLVGRLDRVNVQRSRAGTDCAALVADVDKLRKERLVFEGLQAALTRDFEAKKRDMSVLLDKANDFHEGRTLAQKDLQRVLHEGEDEKRRAAEEHVELDTHINKQENLQSEMQTASLKRRMNQLQAQLVHGLLDPDEEAKLKARLQALTSKIERKTHDLEVNKQQAILNFEQAFDRIMCEATRRCGRDVTLAEVVAQYVSDYDETFSLLGYVQRVQDENFKMESLRGGMMAEMTKLAREQGQHDLNKIRVKNELQAKLDRLQAANCKLRAGMHAKEQCKEQVLAAVERMARMYNERTGLGTGTGTGTGTTLSTKSVSSKVKRHRAHLGRKLVAHGIQRNSVGAIEEHVTDKTLMTCLGQLELKMLESLKLVQQRASFRQSLAYHQDLIGAQLTLCGPASPARSRCEAMIRVQPLSKSDIAKAFDIKPPQHQPDGQEDVDDNETVVCSADELRRVVARNLAQNPANYH